MAKWIRNVKHDVAGFRVAVPMVLVKELGWENCKFVTIERMGDIGVIIRRLQGDDTRGHDSTKHPAEPDR
jgi:bifunctional DNA-binding transcriptional regulator/antitoxin component of YhaV-PrlF toxin-antitoxin module